MLKEAYIAVCLAICGIVPTAYSGLAIDLDPLSTTLTPDVCSTLRQTQTCKQLSFRQTCPDHCAIRCPRSSFVYVSSHGLCYGITGQETVMWSHAQELCRVYGARLAHIKTGSDDQLVSYLQNISNSHSETRFHTGAVNFGVENKWAWLDGSPFSHHDDPYIFWKRGYPKFGYNRPGCLNIYTADEYKKESHRCNINMGFICEQEAIIEDIDVSDGTSFI